MISRERRFVFIHVQKTGGSAITSGLSDAVADLEAVPGAKHVTLAGATKLLPELADYFAMGFVRNPWERLFSWHSMILRRAAGARSGDYDAELYARNDFWQRVARDYPDFESFVLRGTREVRRLRIPQIDYLTTPQRRADFIGRTEHLRRDLERGLALAGLPSSTTVERTNAGPPSDFRVHYTQAMRERVAQVAAADIAEFGYTFDGRP